MSTQAQKATVTHGCIVVPRLYRCNSYITLLMKYICAIRDPRYIYCYHGFLRMPRQLLFETDFRAMYACMYVCSKRVLGVGICPSASTWMQIPHIKPHIFIDFLHLIKAHSFFKDVFFFSFIFLSFFFLRFIFLFTYRFFCI